MGIVKKHLAKAFDNYLTKEGYLERPLFQTNPQELSTMCIYPETTPEQNKEGVNQQNTVNHNSCPRFYPATYEEHPKNNYDLHRVLFWKSLNKCINSYTLDLGWDDIKRHLLEQLRKPILANKNKNNLLLKTYSAIYPENSWKPQRTCQSKKCCLSQLLPTTFFLQLRRNIPWTTMTFIVFCFGNHAMERNASTVTQDLCQSKKDCLSQVLPMIFILRLRRNIPRTTMTSIVFCFGNH